MGRRRPSRRHYASARAGASARERKHIRERIRETVFVNYDDEHLAYEDLEASYLS